MTRNALLLRLGASWATAGALLAAARPPAVGDAWPLAIAAALGLVAGAVLFAALARRRLSWPVLAPSVGLVLVVGAGAEEVVWRWFALSEVASRLGAALAIALTSLAFAVVHRNRSFGHVIAGCVFGLLFVLTGTVVGAWAAHAAYNVLVAGSIRSCRPWPFRTLVPARPARNALRIAVGLQPSEERTHPDVHPVDG